MGNALSRENLTLLTRACVMCGTPERTPEGKLIHWPESQRIPRAVCDNCGSGNLFVNDYVVCTVRREGPITWPRIRTGRPPRNRPPEPE